MREELRRSAIEDDIAADNASGDPVEAQIRRRVRNRIAARNAFYVHTIIFLALNAMLWGIWATAGRGFPWPIFITFSWGAGLVAIALRVYQYSPDVAARQEAEIQREVEAEKRNRR